MLYFKFVESAKIRVISVNYESSFTTRYPGQLYR